MEVVHQIKVGDKLPDAEFGWINDEGNPTKFTTAQLFDGKNVALFAVPGAFTPGCSKTHCPGFVNLVGAIKSKGIDSVLCVAVNDAFVMDAWGEHQRGKGKILFIADGNADFAKSIGMLLDLKSHGLGIRSKRYAMHVVNREVKWIGIDEKGIEHSTAENFLKQL